VGVDKHIIICPKFRQTITHLPCFEDKSAAEISLTNDFEELSWIKKLLDV
jgi:hypothetical protein